MTGIWVVLTVAATVGCALVGGVFFAFSFFVMAGLDRLPAAEAVRAMQAVNVTAVRVPLMTLLFGTAGVCVVLGVRTVFASREVGAVPCAVGAATYLVGVIGVTAVANVPRNTALAAVDAVDTVDAVGPAAAVSAAWIAYRREWTAWNHVRTAASAVGAVAFAWALV